MADRLAELTPFEEPAAACALARNHARAGEQRLEQHHPEDGVRNHELRGHTGDIDTTREI